MAPRDTIPPILRLVLENAGKTHPREADKAGWKLALNPTSREALEKYLAAKRRVAPIRRS